MDFKVSIKLDFLILILAGTLEYVNFFMMSDNSILLEDKTIKLTYYKMFQLISVLIFLFQFISLMSHFLVFNFSGSYLNTLKNIFIQVSPFLVIEISCVVFFAMVFRISFVKVADNETYESIESSLIESF